MMTRTGDQIIGEILDQDMALLPIAISPHGHLGSLFERFLYGKDALPLPEFKENRPNAEAAAKLATSSRHVPRGILKRANDIWRSNHPDTYYGNSFKAMDPWTYFDQELGLIISTAISSHLLRAHNKDKALPPLECPGEECNVCHSDEDEDSSPHQHNTTNPIVRPPLIPTTHPTYVSQSQGLH